MPIPPRVSVVALRTADLARSTAFYVALGWELSAASTAAMSLFKTAGRDGACCHPSTVVTRATAAGR